MLVPSRLQKQALPEFIREHQEPAQYSHLLHVAGLHGLPKFLGSMGDEAHGQPDGPRREDVEDTLDREVVHLFLLMTYVGGRRTIGFYYTTNIDIVKLFIFFT